MKQNVPIPVVIVVILVVIAAVFGIYHVTTQPKKAPGGMPPDGPMMMKGAPGMDGAPGMPGDSGMEEAPEAFDEADE